MKAMVCLIAALVVVILLTGVPNAMAGAYDTGNGQGYASYLSTVIVPKGTIISIVRLQPEVHPKFGNAIDPLQSAVLFRSVFSPVAYDLPGKEI